MAWDPIWEKVFREKDWGKYPGEDFIRFVARNFYRAEDRSKIKILEVGCGTGANLWYMAREGFSVYGIDGSPTAIEKAKKRLDKECPGWKGQLIVGDIGKLTFPDGFFDAVTDCEALSCNSFEDSVAIYKEMARVTRPGGKLFSRTFATGCWGDHTGQNLGRNAWLVAEGPLHGVGYVRFTECNDIPELVPDFALTSLEMLSRTEQGRQHEIKEWIILGEKQ